MKQDLLLGMAQISPVWLNKKQTLMKIKDYLLDAANKKCELVVFGEAVLPGYPFWLTLTNGAAWNDRVNKEIHAHYVQNAIIIEANELDAICKMAKQYKMAIYIGIVERAKNRGSHSLYCSLVYIDNEGIIKSVHRKLQPTYEERLTWSPGDGNGLQVHPLKEFTLGGLNCWENWMPLPRTALYGLGENLHIAVWPGSDYNTRDISRFIAREARSFVVSVSSLMELKDFPQDTPHLDKIIKNAPKTLANGGSCIAGPDGEWIVAPILSQEGVFTHTINIHRVFEERQNFDPVGHYSRPDITQLTVNRHRQSSVYYTDQTDK